jgi:hypothetical protein
VFSNPTEPYILYFDSTSGTMQLGTWGNQITAANYKTTMLWFKFGGVVGFDLSTVNFSTTNIKFNPMTTPSNITGWGSKSTTLPAVPGFTTADYTAGIRNVSGSDYHSVANIKVGRGDPCKLVGLTVDQIQSGVIDNNLYRLPTKDENFAMAGGLADNSGPTAGKYTVSGSWTGSSPGFGTFPTPDPDVVLPSAGFRLDTTGVDYKPGEAGMYWSSVALDNARGHNLHFNSTSVNPSISHFYSYGNAVRCVPQS